MPGCNLSTGNFQEKRTTREHAVLLKKSLLNCYNNHFLALVTQLLYHLVTFCVLCDKTKHNQAFFYLLNNMLVTFSSLDIAGSL